MPPAFAVQRPWAHIIFHIPSRWDNKSFWFHINPTIQHGSISATPTDMLLLRCHEPNDGTPDRSPPSWLGLGLNHPVNVGVVHVSQRHAECIHRQSSPHTIDGSRVPPAQTSLSAYSFSLFSLTPEQVNLSASKMSSVSKACVSYLSQTTEVPVRPTTCHMFIQ